MKFFRIVLYKVFGLKTYLRFVSKIYIKYINLGFGKSKYQELHHLKKIVKPDSVCLDIGANMGYYSYFMSKYSGQNGKVYAVEPVPLFAEIWSKNMWKFKGDRLVLFPFALGEKEIEIEMGMPSVNGVIHHGMTKVVSESDSSFEKTFKAEMKNPDKLFAEIEKLDFIKVDVEGYESQVFCNMLETIKKHSPLIQSELSGKENRMKSIELLNSIGYKPHYLQAEKFEIADQDKLDNYNGDFYFIKK